MIYLFEIYFLICQSFAVGKDALSYKLKDTHTDGLTASRLKRWHEHGVIMAALYVLPGVVVTRSWLPLLAALLIRGTFYNVSFNLWAGLDISFLGQTPKTDKLFIKLFGMNGAVRMAVIFLVLLILFQWPILPLLTKQ